MMISLLIHPCKLEFTSKEMVTQIIMETGKICNLQFVDQVAGKTASRHQLPKKATEESPNEAQHH